MLFAKLWSNALSISFRRVVQFGKLQRNMFTIALFAFVLTIGGIQSAPTSEEIKNTFARASCDFSLQILKELSKSGDSNVLLSPSSISVLLAILQQGAKENTAEQLKTVLRLTSDDAKSGFASVIRSLKAEKTNVTLNWGNRVYVKSEFPLNEEFKKNAEENFDAGIESMNFLEVDSAARINQWVAEVTQGLIQNLVDPSTLTEDTAMVLVNAIYFKGLWKFPFKKEHTLDSTFNVDEKTIINVPYLKQTKKFKAGVDPALGIKYLELPFRDPNFSMIFVIPAEDRPVNEILEKLTGSDLLNIISNTASRSVRMLIPKFKLTKKTSLVDALKNIGLVDLFTPAANLEGVAATEKLSVSEVVHEADVEIDEDGTTAAASTYDVVHTLSLEYFPDELPFVANKPFLFFIVDKGNKVPLFAGKIKNPIS